MSPKSEQLTLQAGLLLVCPLQRRRHLPDLGLIHLREGSPLQACTAAGASSRAGAALPAARAPAAGCHLADRGSQWHHLWRGWGEAMGLAVQGLLQGCLSCVEVDTLQCTGTCG